MRTFLIVAFVLLASFVAPVAFAATDVTHIALGPSVNTTPGVDTTSPILDHNGNVVTTPVDLKTAPLGGVTNNSSNNVVTTPVDLNTAPFGGVTNNSSNVAPSGGSSDSKLLNPLKGGTSLEAFLNDILTFVIRIGTIVVILMLVFVGYKFVAAQGNESKITEARGMLLWTIIGALILLGAQAIAIAIKSTVAAIGG